ncbi:hypothetical protein [Actinospica sp.]|jgi:hypothetical protein|uniref:hypothetical protein n=1 Tax=Actinospica sp. TaxID=1872142 RepID=UPI002BF314D9|nr:hypothetical protein [Actinospica sp.]HWG27723.1 hypothetical protein [Actinospica sp.]
MTGASPGRSSRLETPSRLWLLLVAAVAAVLTVGLVAGFSLAGRESSASRTAHETELLYTEVQNLSYSLADANATAATALLIGPETPGQFTSRYNDDITQAEDLLAAASQRVTGDAYASEQLRSVAEQLPAYAGMIGQALAENRLGYPVAGAYLRQASELLTGSMLVETRHVVTEQQGATSGGLGSSTAFPWWEFVLGVLAIAALWAVSRRIAGISRRRLNLGLLGAALSVVVLLVWSLYAAGAVGLEGNSARTDYMGLAAAQTQTSELSLAETYVALQQIDRGEDQGADASAAASALAAASPENRGDARQVDVANAYGTLNTCAQNVIKLANAGNYQQAITQTVGSGANVGGGGCEPAVGALRADLLKVAAIDQAQFDQDMSNVASEYAGGAAFPLALGIGILGAAAAAYGVNRRLAEFR